MTYSTIKVEKSDGVATVVLNRPPKLNALNREMFLEIPEALGQLARDDSVMVVVLTGAGNAFCAGGDIDWFNSAVQGEKSGESQDGLTHSDNTRFCLSLRGMPQPTIASINGAAVGGGMTMTLNCDIRIAAEEAFIMFPFTTGMAVVPELGSTYALPRLVGIARACELVFTGRGITGKEAGEMGLVNEVVPRSELRQRTADLAQSIARASTRAVQLIKRGLHQGLSADVYSQLLWEEEGLRFTLGSEDNREAISAFLEKRRPVFK